MLNPQALEGKRILVTTNLVAQRKSLCYHAFCTIQLLPMALDRHDPGGSQEQEDVPATFEGRGTQNPRTAQVGRAARGFRRNSPLYCR